MNPCFLASGLTEHAALKIAIAITAGTNQT
jgi:hypothetical protein